MWTKLKIAVTALGLTACLLLVALWVRSNSRLDRVDWPIARVFPGYTLATVSARGLLLVGVQQEQNRANGGRSSKWRFRSEQIGNARVNHIEPGVLGFKVIHGPNEWGLQVPCWAAVAVTGFCAALPWAKWARRFSMRTLMIVTTIVALMLAAVVIANRVVNSP